MSLVHDRMRGIIGALTSKCGCTLTDNMTLMQAGVDKSQLTQLNSYIKSYFNIEINDETWNSWDMSKMTIYDVANHVTEIM